MAADRMHLLGFMMYTPINRMTLSWADPEDRQIDGRKSLEPQCKNIMALHRAAENLNPAISKACQTRRPQYRPNPLHKR